MLTSRTTNTDVPATFAATVTVTGQADLASADSGECTIGARHVAPNDQVAILGDSGPAYASSTLQVGSIDQNPDGTAVCTYTAHFAAVPANQRSYAIWMNNFARQSVTSDELENGATYVLRSSTPTASGAGTDGEHR